MYLKPIIVIILKITNIYFRMQFNIRVQNYMVEKNNTFLIVRTVRAVSRSNKIILSKYI